MLFPTQSIALVKEYVSISASFPSEKLNPFLIDAESRYLLPYLGADLLAELSAYVLTPDPLKPELGELLPVARRALAPFAVYMAAPETSINFGDTGHTVTRNTNLAPASDRKIENATNSLLDRAWYNTELLIQFMEEHTLWFPTWAYTAKTDFIATATIFQEVGLVDINRSRLIFEKMRLLITGINEREVIKLLGGALYNTLRTAPVGSLHNDIIKLIVKYTANKAASIITSNATAEAAKRNEQARIVITAIYKDLYTNGNYYGEQADYYWSELEALLNANAEILGLTISTPFAFNSAEGRIFTAEG